MYVNHENIFYYITMMNEPYTMPPMPEGAEEGILKGMYRFSASSRQDPQAKAHLLGSGTILNEAIKAAELLENEYNIAADVWSVTSYKELYTDATEAQRWSMLHPDQPPKESYIEHCFRDAQGVFVTASDYLRALSGCISKWLPGRTITLGADGFGRSEGRSQLRDYFEVDYRFITLAALYALMQEGQIEVDVLKQAMEKMNIDTEKINPMFI